MARVITVGAAQLGPIARQESRGLVVKRLLDLLAQAQGRGCDLVVFPELALTTFFPRWWMEDQAEIDAFFEREMPGPETRPLFDEAARLGMAFCLGYAELIRKAAPSGATTPRSWWTAPGASSASTARSICPATPSTSRGGRSSTWRSATSTWATSAFRSGARSAACSACASATTGAGRRRIESWALQGVEMILLGYNTPAHNPPAPEHDPLGPFHNHLVMQAGAYQNATWVVGVAKCGREEGCDLIGQSAIIAPSGEIVAQAATLGDELITARCDLDLTRSYKDTIFNFARHRRPEHYRLIIDRVGAEPPPEERR